MKRLTCALLAALSAPLALAAEKPYIGIDYQFGNFQLDSGEQASPTTVRLRAGTEIRPYLALEAQVGTNAQTDSFTLNDNITQAEVKINNFYGVFLRPQYSLNDFASIYGLFGGSHTSLSVTAPTGEKNWSKNNASMGVGLDFVIHENTRFTLDYVEYNNSYSAVAVGLRIPLQ